MEDIFSRYRKIRTFLLDSVHNLTTEQLNHIPAGFSNNIAWHLGHVIAAQQGVCYLRSGQKIKTEEFIWNNYKPGSKPEKYIDSEEIDQLKSLSHATIDILEKDFLANGFSNYTPWTTRYGVELTNINSAMDFLFFHEGMHAGYVAAMKKCLRK